MAERIDDIVKALIDEGSRKGFLTYAEMNKLLEDQFLPPDRMDQVFLALEDQGVDVVDDEEPVEEEDTGGEDLEVESPRSKSKDEGVLERVVSPEKIDDPVRMYLTQMGEIPLLTRDQ